MRSEKSLHLNEPKTLKTNSSFTQNNLNKG